MQSVSCSESNGGAKDGQVIAPPSGLLLISGKTTPLLQSC
jgi:hypothetical protein